MTEEWQDIPEDDGITLGPEEALEREIAKSKALKVERLQLKDQVERLTAQNRALRDDNEALKKHRQARSGSLENSTEKTRIPTSDTPHAHFSPKSLGIHSTGVQSDGHWNSVIFPATRSGSHKKHRFFAASFLRMTIVLACTNLSPASRGGPKTLKTIKIIESRAIIFPSYCVIDCSFSTGYCPGFSGLS